MTSLCFRTGNGIALAFAILAIALGHRSARADISTPNVTVSNTQISATAQYNIAFVTNFQLLGEQATPGVLADELNITFPAGTVSNVTTASQIRINGTVPNHVAVNGLIYNIRLDFTINAGATVTVQFLNPPGTINPSTAGSYQVSVSTTAETNNVLSNPYSITSSATLTSATVIPTSSVIGQASGYRLNFRLGGAGALTAPSGTFTLVFPSNTVVPDGQMYGATVNGTSTVVIGVSGTRTVQIQTPVSLANLTDVTLDFSPSSGLINPTTPTTYTLTVATTAEATPKTSNAYTLFSGLSLAPPSVILNPTTVNKASTYDITSKLGTTGGLTANTDTLFLTLPTNTIVPGLISTADVVINNGVYPANPATVITNPSTRLVKMVPGTSIANGADVTITVQADGNITNPTLAQNFTLDFWTNKEATVTSNAYLTTAATTTISQPLVTLSNTAVNAISNYTFTFNVGGQGRLLGGVSTITIVLPPGTTFPNQPIATTNVTVNGVASAGINLDATNRTIIITVPASVSIGNNGAVTIVISGSEIRNPNANTTVTATLNTSVETVQVLSGQYKIGTGGTSHNVTAVNLSTNIVNTASQYAISWQQTAGEQVNAGEFITIGFPANTIVPSSISTANIIIDPSGAPPAVNPTTVTTFVSEREIEMECPVTLALNQTHIITITVAGGLINPSIPQATYKLSLRTTDASVEDDSPTYTIAASPTAPAFPAPPPPHVTVAPDRAAEIGAYTINFTTGAAGALLAGQSAINITFPVGTTIPASMNGSALIVNGILVSAVTTTPASRLVSLTTPINIPANTAVNLILTTAADIINPSTASYTLSLTTTAQTGTATSNSYTITSNNTLAVLAVTPDPTAINANAGYVIQFKLGAGGGSDLAIGDQIIADFPDLTGAPGVMAPGDVRVNNIAAAVTPFTDTVSKQVTVTTPVAVAVNGTVTLAFTNAAGLSNPSTVNSYTLTIATNKQPTPQTSPSYQITAATTTITPAQVTPTVGVINQISTYTVVFNVGAQGALQAGTSTIALVFSASTTLPASFQTSNVTVNGVNPSVVNKTGQTVTITVPSGVNVGNNGLVTIVLGSSTAVITNPSGAGNYTINASTSVETTVITSLPYPIGTATSTVTPAIVTPSPNSVDNLAQYTLQFNLGATGALTAGTGTITVIFPNNTSVPFSMAAANITVNGTPVAATPSSVPLSRSITLTTPVNIANNGAVTLVFAVAAGLRNPSTGGTYTLQVHTSVEQTKVTSQAYTIAAPITTVTPATVTPSPSSVNTPAQYTVAFNVGGSGGLQGGVSTITLILPPGTTVPTSIAVSKVTVNGTQAAAVVTNGQQILITIPASVTIANNGAATIVIATEASMINPQIQGQYTLDVSTSAEPTAVTSNPYTITGATTTVTPATVTPNPATITVTADYTIFFNVGSSGGLQAGSSTITVTLNASTPVATGAITGATINGAAAQAVSDGATRTVVMTMPASVNVGNSGAVTAFIPSGVLINPSSANTYTLQVKTSVETTNVTSNGYIISTAASVIAITAVNQFATNAANQTSARLLYTFTTGAQGALTSGSSTITTTFPDNTIVPASIAVNQIQVEGTNVLGPVTINASLRTVTFTIPINVAANTPNIDVDFLTTAALTNPSAGNYTLQARTSVEATNITSPSYTVIPAATSVSAATVSVQPNLIETNGAYTVTFTVGASGRLLAGSSTLTVTFPAGTSVPASITASTITVNGVPATSVSPAGQAVTITVPNGVSINNSSTVVIVFNTGAGLFNPPTATSYTLTVKTNTETTAVTSNSYSIFNAATSTTVATVVPNPGQQSVNAQYTFSFNTGGQGALQPGLSTITTTFPAGTTVPGSIAGSNVSVNSTAASTVVTNAGARTVTVTVPGGVSIGDNSSVILVLGVSSNVINNPATGNYTSQVRTSKETTNITTNSYFISNVTSTVDSAFVGPIQGGASPDGGASPQTVNTVAAYNIKFKLGAQGGLTAGVSQITLTFPSNTTVPTSINQTLMTVNSTALTVAPTCNAALRTIILTVPPGTPTIANNDTVRVDLSSSALLVNPTLAGFYRLQVRTSVEATNIPSKLYRVLDAVTTVTAVTVTPTPDEFEQNAQYRIDLSVGAQGALLAGISTVTFTLPANTLAPTVMPASKVTFNGVTISTVVSDSVNRVVTVTVPASVNVPNNGSITVIFLKDALLINPDPGSKTLTARTSVELPAITSQAYTIRNVATIQQANKISLHPRWQPSDTRLAYLTEAPDDASGKDTGNWNIFLIRKDGRDKQQVTSAVSGATRENGDPIHFSSLTWTPDGDSLVYTGYERLTFPPSDTIYTLQLFQIHRDGGTFKKISPRGAFQDTLKQFGGWLDPDWAVTSYGFEAAEFPAGVHRAAASLDGNIWVFEPRHNSDGPGSTFKNLIQITNLPTAGTKTDGLFQPKWSPDRRKLAVVYKDSSATPLSNVYVIANVDSIIRKTLESPLYSRQQFTYDIDVGAFAVNELTDMTKMTSVSNTLPSWTPGWSTDGTQVSYSQDQANVFALNTFSTSPANAVLSTNFYVKMRNADGTGPDSVLIGVASANNAFPTMSNNGQRFGYFQAATTGPFLQKQKVFYLQTTGKFSPPSTPRVVAKQEAALWRLADLGYSAIEFPVTAVNQDATFFLFEPETIPTDLIDSGRYIGVARQFGPAEVHFFEPAAIALHYTDGELAEAGFVSGSDQEQRLALFYYNPETQVWEKVQDSLVDPARNVVSGTVAKLGVFGIFYESPGAGQLFSQAMVYPNPFRPNSGASDDGDYSTGIIFDLLPLNMDRLDIYNLAGEWVASSGGAIAPTSVPGQWRWSGTNDAGHRVSSGIYLYVMEAAGERKIGKIAVIR